MYNNNVNNCALYIFSESNSIEAGKLEDHLASEQQMEFSLRSGANNDSFKRCADEISKVLSELKSEQVVLKKPKFGALKKFN